MPNGKDPNKPQTPGSGPGAETGRGAGGSSGAGPGPSKAPADTGGASPEDNDRPPQTNIAVAAAVGGLIGSSLRS
jgi:hypothetical protein